MVLHTWGQQLDQHLHVHCLVSGGRSAPTAIDLPAPRLPFPVEALSTVFRGKSEAALKRAFACGALTFAGSTAPLTQPGARGALRPLYSQPWVVYTKALFAGPEQYCSISAATPTASRSPTTAW